MKTAATTQTITAREAITAPRRSLHLTARQRQAVLEAEEVWRRLTLQLLQDDGLPKPAALGVTSSIRGEGRTTSSISLAAAFARETGDPVLLVDGDLKRPAIARTCDLAPSPGLGEVLLDRVHVEKAFRPTALPNLAVVVAGDTVRLSGEISGASLSTLLRKRLKDLLVVWKDYYKHVVIDLPALHGDSNAEEMARQLDGVLLVARSGITPLEKVRQASGLLQGANLVGAVHISQPSAVPGWISQLIAD